MIYKKEPNNWNPKFIVVSCIVEFNGKILLLRRLFSKLEGNKWGVIAGKVNEGETNIQALIRELKEETGLDIGEEKPEPLRMYYVDHPWFRFNYHPHILKLESEPIVTLNPKEHTEYKWVTPKEALNQELVKDEHIVLEEYYRL